MKTMGSLPNLHELSAGFVDADFQNELFAKANEDKDTFIYWKKKDHAPIFQTRSLGSNPDSCVTNVSLLKKLNQEKYDFTSRRSRSARSSSVIHCHLHSVNTTNLHKHISRQASVTSSTGTSSVRKLIAVVHSTPSHLGPVYSRPLICQNFVALCLAHGMFTIAFVPIIILQGSISVWWYPTESYGRNVMIPNAGSLLVATLYFVGAFSALGSPFVVHKMGPTKSLVLCYAIGAVFVGVHLYPKLYLLIPMYLVMGISIGHLSNTKMTYLLMLALKLKFVLSEEEECEFQSKLESTKRESLAQKLFRGLSFAQNAGLIIGSMITYSLIKMTAIVKKSAEQAKHSWSGQYHDCTCGYESCPQNVYMYNEHSNNSNVLTGKSTLILPCKTSAILAGVFLGCCVVSTLVAVLFMYRIRISYSHGPNVKTKFQHRFKILSKTFRNSKLKFITPLLVFIGIEQGFMFADFTELYVICVMGVQNAPLVFISLGLLQSIAGITLSLLIQHIRRYFIIGVGFVFQACLLLVLILWKPTSDDAALFYVISAAWGVCNAIWDTLTFCLLVSLFPDFWEFPFSHSYFFRYLGLSVAFAYHGYICTSIKLYIMCVMLLMAVFPYAWLEIKLDLKANSRKIHVSKWHH